MSDDTRKQLVRLVGRAPTPAKGPTVSEMLADIARRAGYVVIRYEAGMTAEPFSASVSGRNVYLAFDGETPGKAIAKLWRVVTNGGMR